MGRRSSRPTADLRGQNTAEYQEVVHIRMKCALGVRVATSATRRAEARRHPRHFHSESVHRLRRREPQQERSDTWETTVESWWAQTRWKPPLDSWIRATTSYFFGTTLPSGLILQPFFHPDALLVQSQCGPIGSGWLRSGCSLSPVSGLCQLPSPDSGVPLPFHPKPGPGGVSGSSKLGIAGTGHDGCSGRLTQLCH
jgi:hypothetical protein